jgi:hypothetical protein
MAWPSAAGGAGSAGGVTSGGGASPTGGSVWTSVVVVVEGSIGASVGCA